MARQESAASIGGGGVGSPSTADALILATPLAVAFAALLPGGKWLLPVLAAACLVPGFVGRVRGREWGKAWALGMAWAGLLSAAVVALVVVAPERAAAVVLNAEPYRHLMFGWIFEGHGPELEWRQFLPEHALHLGGFVLLTVLSGGVLGLILGAVLVSYMSYFVGSYAVASGHLLLGPIVAWVPWSVARVAAFVLLGCLLARPVLVRRWDLGRREARLAALAGLGIAIDIGLKMVAAAPYGRFLASLAGS